MAEHPAYIRAVPGSNPGARTNHLVYPPSFDGAPYRMIGRIQVDTSSLIYYQKIGASASIFDWG